MPSHLRTLGLLLNNRDYFVPYVDWLFSQNGILYDIVGCIDNGPLYDTVPGYLSKKTVCIKDLASKSDIMLSLGYWKIIRKDILDIVPFGILNVHHSFLLRYRGRHAATWAILNGERSHGSTLHYMTELLDDGPILATTLVPILETDTAYSLFQRTNAAAFDMVQKSLPLAISGERSPNTCFLFPDPDYKTYRKKDLPLEIPISTLSEPDKLLRHIRALTYPGCPKPFMTIGSMKISMGVVPPEVPCE